MDDSSRVERLEELIIGAFISAYPGIPVEDVKHMARNFAQVVSGIVSIGESQRGAEDFNHMDLANGLVCSCVWGSRLGEMLQKCSEEGRSLSISPGELRSAVEEISARVADWLLGIDVLREMGEPAYGHFVRGALALGAKAWERDRSKIKY